MREVGESVSWGEADLLIESLLREQGSHVVASLNGWPYPFDRHSHILSATWNALVAANWNRKKGGEPPRWPSPLDHAEAPSSPDDIDDDEARAILSRTLGRPIT